MRTILYIAIFSLIVTTKLSAATPFKITVRPDKDSVLLARFLDLKADSKNVLIAGGTRQGIVEGATYVARRIATTIQSRLSEPTWVETGRVRIVKTEESMSFGFVEQETGPFSAAFFPKFPQLMGGDWLTLEQVSIVKNIQAIPDLTVAFDDLFIDPKAFPTSFELSDAGKAKLQELVAKIQDLRVSALLIEGHTDPEGDAAVNQVESFQRATTVRQYLISELGIDAERIVAVGMGESEVLAAHNEPGHQSSNRRIVLKARTF